MSTAFITALRYLSARKLRAALTTLAVVFGVAVIFAGNLVLPSAIDAFRRTSLGASGTVDITIASATGGTFAPSPALEQAAAVAGVKAVTGVLQRPISVGIGGNSGQAVIVGVDPATINQVRVIKLAAGRFLQAGDGSAVVLGDNAASAATLGGTIKLPSVGGVREYTVVGKLESGGVPASDVYMTLPDAQALLGLPGQISALELATAPGVDRANVQANLLAALGPDFQAGARSAVDSVASLDIGYAMFNFIGALALFIGAFLIFNTFRTIVLERKRDLAMLRAIGAERGQVTAILIFESLIQGVVGSVLGLVVGGLLALGLLAAIRSIAASFYSGVSITVEFSWQAVVPALLAGMLTTLLAGYLPARAAGRLSPLEALRPASIDEAQKTARWNLIIGAVLCIVAIGLLFGGAQAATGGAILFLIGLTVASPALIAPVARLFAPLLSGGFAGEGQIAEGNLRRQPGRAAVTASTLMIGLATMVMIASVISSFDQMIVTLFNKNFASDIMLLPQNIALLNANLGAGNQLAEKLRAVPGVQAVGTLRTAAGTVAGKSVNVDGIDPAVYPLVSPLTFAQGDEANAFTTLGQGRTAIANSIFATAQRLKVGDMLTVATPKGPQQYKIVGVASDALSFKINTLYVSPQTLEQDFGAANDVLLMLKLAPGADLNTVKQQVTAIAASYPQFTVNVTADYRQQLIDLSLNALRGAFVPLALIILLPAALGLLNTLTMSVLERTREIGITRAIGASRSQVRRIVIAEALLLGLFGAALGALAGLAMSYGFTAALGSSFGIALPFSFPLLGIVAALVFGLGITLLVSALPARAAARLNILQALRYE